LTNLQCRPFRLKETVETKSFQPPTWQIAMVRSTRLQTGTALEPATEPEGTTREAGRALDPEARTLAGAAGFAPVAGVTATCAAGGR
jgi:hypothetical protein